MPSVHCTQSELEDCMFGTANYGGCLNCGYITHDSCEPDARNYECPECGENQVFGLEELMMMGCLVFDE